MTIEAAIARIQHLDLVVDPANFDMECWYYLARDQWSNELFNRAHSHVPSEIRSHLQHLQAQDNKWGAQCEHCGTRHSWGAVFRHKETKNLIAVGNDCAREKFNFDSKQERALEILKREVKVIQMEQKAQKYLEENPEIAEALQSIKRLGDVKGRLFYRGKLTEGEEKYVHRLLRYRDEFLTAIQDEKVKAEFEELIEDNSWYRKQYEDSGYIHPLSAALREHRDKKARQAALQARIEAERAKVVEAAQEVSEKEAPQTSLWDAEGRVEVVGRVISVKDQETQYGWTQKMLVENEQGLRVWGTVPKAIKNVEKGNIVTFVAGFEQSSNDPKFGFFSRPSQAKILEA